jgi:aspartate-semialdehyde dehydrogenase
MVIVTMAGGTYRIGIVGAASLVGRELNDALADSEFGASDVVLLDAEDAAGRITVSGDEPAFIQKLEDDSFNGLDFVFFAGDAETTRRTWKKARAAGASIIDLTYALEEESGLVVRSLWDQVPVGKDLSRGNLKSHDLDLTTTALVIAHPAAAMLLLLSQRLQTRLPARLLAATVFEPASQHGQLAMDELHQQTVSLLSFQSLPRDQYDAQVAFNLLPSLGDAAKVKLAATKTRIQKHYELLSADDAASLVLQLVQAPVFHSYTVSVLVELEEIATTGQLETGLKGEHVDTTRPNWDPPSNVSAAGQSEVSIRIESADAGAKLGRRFWLWLASDNLKLTALTAVACASELRSLRPRGAVQ